MKWSMVYGYYYDLGAVVAWAWGIGMSQPELNGISLFHHDKPPPKSFVSPFSSSIVFEILSQLGWA
jgi:hypothetical protein